MEQIEKQEILINNRMESIQDDEKRATGWKMEFIHHRIVFPESQIKTRGCHDHYQGCNVKMEKNVTS